MSYVDIRQQGSVVVQGGSDEGDAEARMRRDKIKEVRERSDFASGLKTSRNWSQISGW